MLVELCVKKKRKEMPLGAASLLYLRVSAV